jgi:hypothetical protein
MNERNATQSLSNRFLNLPPAPRYETAGGLSTRMIIESASYTTTPRSSPPPEPSHVYSANDNHHRVPGVAALTEANHLLERQLHQGEIGHYAASHKIQAQPPNLEIGQNKDGALNNRIQHSQGIVPSYMLHAIATSEVAGLQARTSAEQTLLSSKTVRHEHASKGAFVLTAPSQRQLEDGRWIVVH